MPFLGHSYSSLQRADPGDRDPERWNAVVFDESIDRLQQLVDAFPGDEVRDEH